MVNYVTVNDVEVEYKRVKNDVNGNPRYVIHFLYFLRLKEIDYKIDINSISKLFNQALKISREIGGKKYRGKDCGGCIVVSSYNLKANLETLIKDSK